MASSRIAVQKANGGLAVETAVVANDQYLFSNRGTSVVFFVVPTAQTGKKVSLKTFRNSAGKGFTPEPESFDVVSAGDELYIVSNLLTNTFNNDQALVEFTSSATGTLMVFDKAAQ